MRPEPVLRLGCGAFPPEAVLRVRWRSGRAAQYQRLCMPVLELPVLALMRPRDACRPASSGHLNAEPLPRRWGTGRFTAHAAAARSQLQDKLLLLMGSNVVAYTSAFCGGVDVPNLANLTRFSGSRCQGEEFDIAKLDARVEEAPPATSSEQMTTQHLMKSLGEVVHILHDGNATAKSVRPLLRRQLKDPCNLAR